MNGVPPVSTRFGGGSVLRLLALALFVWIASAVTLVVWFFSTTTRDLGLGAVAVPFAMVGIGYMLGGGVMLAAGALQVRRRQATARTVGWAIAIYIAPVAVMALSAAVIPRVAPLTAVESDLGGMLSAVGLPIALLLLAVGLAIGWSRMRRRDTARQPVLVVMSFVLAGAVGVGMWQTWRQLSSPEARARGALQFSVEGGRWIDGGLALDATLALSRDAAYHYDAIYLEEQSGSTGGRVDEVQWADGAPPQRQGLHRCRLIWRSLQHEPNARNRRVIFSVRGAADRTGYEPPVAEFRVPLDDLLGAGASRSR